MQTKKVKVKVKFNEITKKKAFLNVISGEVLDFGGIKEQEMSAFFSSLRRKGIIYKLAEDEDEELIKRLHESTFALRCNVAENSRERRIQKEFIENKYSERYGVVIPFYYYKNDEVHDMVPGVSYVFKKRVSNKKLYRNKKLFPGIRARNYFEIVHTDMYGESPYIYSDRPGSY